MGSNEETDNKSAKNFKFKSLKVYASEEWMANSTKKYRMVFDRMETTYIWAEFQFFNKLFDEGAWEATVGLKAFQVFGTEKTELCKLESKRPVTIEDNIVSVHDGWGNAEAGRFWQRGEYLWEAYIDGEFVGSQRFFIEDAGQVTPEVNPYFDVESVKLFPGPFDLPAENTRRYVKKFKRDETPYIWIEFKWKNKIADGWNFEVFFNIYDDAHHLKASMNSYAYINPDSSGTLYTTAEGWGAQNPGSWQHDKYFLEIVFMDTLICTAPFEVGGEFEEGVPELGNLAAFISAPVTKEPEQIPETLEDLMKKLDELIGLSDIKKKIREHISYIDFLKLRKEKGLTEENEKLSLHSVFTGNPGTGKTTVVKLLGKIYNKMGLLSKGHVMEVDRADLIAQFIGQTAPKVKKAIDDARGGILFIDEAYSLAREGDDDKDFGKEAIEILLKEMSDGPGDIAIMVAGYPKEMEHFLESNPGMKSRFNYYFHFDDYTPDELLKIADLSAVSKHISFSAAASEYLFKLITEAYRNRDRTFGNARYAISVVDEGKMNLGMRLMNRTDVKDLAPEILSTIEFEDMDKIITLHQKRRPDLKVDEELLAAAMSDLKNLVGMDTIKQEVNDLVKLVRYYRETGKDILNRFSLHSVFTGNPGTGKTTMARIIARIYKALGLLERGHVVEADRERLVAGYVGQTAIKTKQLIDDAKGGVLFIDEAYALAEGGSNDFGREAIEILLKNMEDMRGELSVIVAGYPDNMHEFLESNPGLKSRFDKTFYFPDFSPAELFEIAVSILRSENLTADSETEAHLKNYFESLHASKDKYFGNARTIRNLAGQAIRNQQLRMAGISPELRTRAMMETLTIEDVKFVETVQQTGGRPIGFKK